MKKLLLLFILFMGLNMPVEAQSSWSRGDYYATCGNVWTEYASYTEWSNYYGCYINVEYYRTVRWHSKWRKGYINNWIYMNERYQWHTTWHSGYQWWYTWSRWRRC